MPKLPMTKNIFYSILMGFIFLIFAVVTLSDYNIMWDARGRFMRGQAFANFFLYGIHNYNDIPVTEDVIRYFRDYRGQEISGSNIKSELSSDKDYRRSIYKDESTTFDYRISLPATGHPPLSDIGAAFFNIAFYEKLGIVRDDHAYALYSVVLASILVGVFFYWIASQYGFFSAIVATITLSTTPLFWAETHNNIKDIPLLVFFSLTIWSLWKGVVGVSKKWIIFSAIFAGCALGTKFNIVFLPFIVVPWFFAYFFTHPEKRKFYYQWWWVFLLYPIIALAIFFASWPQLWKTPIASALNVVAYYKDIGTNIDYTPAFRTLFGFNTYAFIWVLFTTFPVVIALSFIGIIGWIVRIKKTKDFLPLLFLLWLIVPILRVSMPNSAIYGGVRQIMEYIPALAFFAGYGAKIILKILPIRFKTIGVALILASFIPLFITLVRQHPAENAYFNSLIGGLPGAKNANLTGWGNTDGSIYEKAVIWLDRNAQENTHIATAFSEPADFYIPALRKDLFADNQFSGYLQKGEYIVGLTHDSGLENTYGLRYPETFLDPLYVFSVDGVPLLKIWKNDKENLKKAFLGLKLKSVGIMSEKKDNELLWKFNDQKQIVAVEVEFDQDNLCKPLESASFQVSTDGEYWNILPETYPGEPFNFLGSQPKNNKLIAPIGILASNLALVVSPKDSCLFNIRSSKITVLE